MSKKLDKKRARREAELRRQQELKRQAQRRNLMTIGLAAIVVVVVVALVYSQRSSAPAKIKLSDANPTQVPTDLAGLMTSNPPWPANNGSDLGKRLDTLGFPKGAMESLDFHIHQHLDIYVHGSKATVPANIGISTNPQYITILHTHDTGGVIHVESPIQQNYSLGQFFAVWGLRLTPHCIGGLCNEGDNTLTAYVNGKKVANPRDIILKEHEEIVLAYGTPSELPDPIPSKYHFPTGE